MPSVAYQLPQALRRSMLAELEAAAKVLTDATVGTDTGVHEARKHLKRLRALVAIAPDLLLAKERLAISTVARSLGRVRDPVAQLETWRKLESTLPSEVAARARAVLQGKHAHATAAPHVELRVRRSAQVLGGVRQAAAVRWAATPDNGGMDADAILRGLRRTYRQGRRALRRALESPDAAHLHDLRRASKKHGFQLSFLQQVLGTEVHGHGSRFSRLADDLGEHHDLAAIAQILLDAGAVEAAVRRQLTRRLRRLADRALRRARRIYARRPKAFERRLRRYLSLEPRDG